MKGTELNCTDCSGGQYLDGTTDVTRTFHYGEPSPAMVRRYTDVLRGQIGTQQQYLWQCEFIFGINQ